MPCTGAGRRGRDRKRCRSSRNGSSSLEQRQQHNRGGERVKRQGIPMQERSGAPGEHITTPPQTTAHVTHTRTHRVNRLYEVPVRPARAARPLRCTNSLGLGGKSAGGQGQGQWSGGWGWRRAGQQDGVGGQHPCVRCLHCTTVPSASCRNSLMQRSPSLMWDPNQQNQYRQQQYQQCQQ